jgi:DNA-binding MarR family transcriptional regulator
MADGTDLSELPLRLRTAVGRLGRQLRQTRAGADLTPSQYEVLATVVGRGQVRLTELAELEGLHPTMLSRVVGKLEQRGLVTRSPDPTDGRVVHVAAARPGRDLVARIRRERTDVLSMALTRLDDAERQSLLVALPVLESLAELVKDRTP